MIELTEVPDSDGKKKILVQKNKNRKAGRDRKSTRLNSSHVRTSRMPSSA